MIEFFNNFVKAIFLNLTFFIYPCRSRSLRAQYSRAKALPRFGTRITNNKLAQSENSVDISVIITCYNYESYIAEAIQSVFNSLTNSLSVEIVVVDDASSDNSNKVVRRMLNSAPIPIRLVRNIWNVGLSKSRNIGIRNSRGNFIFVLDADNLILPQALANLYDVLKSSNAGAAYGPIRRIKLSGEFDGFVSASPIDANFLLTQGNHVDAMAMFRRSVLVEVGGYDISMTNVIGGWEDYALWLELLSRKVAVAFTPEDIGIYRVKPFSMVTQITQGEIIAFREIARLRYPGFTAFSELK